MQRSNRPDTAEANMKRFVLATALAVAALVAGSLVAPVQSGPYWYPGSGPTTGGM